MAGRNRCLTGKFRTDCYVVYQVRCYPGSYQYPPIGKRRSNEFRWDFWHRTPTGNWSLCQTCPSQDVMKLVLPFFHKLSTNKYKFGTISRTDFLFYFLGKGSYQINFLRIWERSINGPITHQHSLPKCWHINMNKNTNSDAARNSVRHDSRPSCGQMHHDFSYSEISLSSALRADLKTSRSTEG